MARVNVRCWQETYRGLMSDAVLDDPGFLAARERFWTAALTDERYRENRVAVAERNGELVGIAMSGPPLDAEAAWARQLYVLYVLAADHGTGDGRRLAGRGSPRMGRCLGRGLGADPREIEADGYDDGFDVLQCRVDLGAGPALPETVPLARRDAPYSGDNCGNAGGLDQDIFGAMVPVS